MFIIVGTKTGVIAILTHNVGMFSISPENQSNSTGLPKKQLLPIFFIVLMYLRLFFFVQIKGNHQQRALSCEHLNAASKKRQGIQNAFSSSKVASIHVVVFIFP